MYLHLKAIIPFYLSYVKLHSYINLTYDKLNCFRLYETAVPVEIGTAVSLCKEVCWVLLILVQGAGRNAQVAGTLCAETCTKLFSHGDGLPDFSEIAVSHILLRIFVQTLHQLR